MREFMEEPEVTQLVTGFSHSVQSVATSGILSGMRGRERVGGRIKHGAANSCRFTKQRN